MRHNNEYWLIMMDYESKKNDLRILLYISLVINLFLTISIFYIVCQKTDIYKRLLTKIGITNYNSSFSRHQIEYRCLEGWANCLNKSNDTMDVVFYGNSLTYESNFHEFFPNLKICNLGCNRDNLDDLIHRSFIIKNVRPYKIFVLGGINSIINISLEMFDEKYSALVDTIMNQNPTSQVYLQSLLPVNVDMNIGSRYVDCQEKIKEANVIISNISKMKGCIYVDLYSAYQVNDSMPKSFTRDGLHLYPEAYSIWSRVIFPYLLK